MESITFYRSYYEAIKELDPEQQLEVYDALFQYGLDGVMPELTGASRAVFLLMRPNIDASNRKRTKNAENGGKGGRPQTSPAAGDDENPTETQPKPNANPKQTQPKPKSENRKPVQNPEEEGEVEVEGDREEEVEWEKEEEGEREGARGREQAPFGAAAPSPSGKAPAKSPPRHKYGQYGWIRLTDAEYDRLLQDLGEKELARCVAYVDESAQSNGNKNRWKDWNLVLRRCHKQGWGLARSGPSHGAPGATYAAARAPDVFDDLKALHHMFGEEGAS